ncbi:YrvL family regulatory protein [Ornithinibacillus halophilus]|uniref:Regulatory protein YrvL n=1 Tax=Ornithinibacillus halophilus TaxID=930117 RepID=A0A1M5HPY2_9BACI|nr:YrvL family regulatory protein [Ornithinibacillus halophilus]SHG17995.1 Regulatory protein YrvL [Ornithinibacillus halophilus]
MISISKKDDKELGVGGKITVFTLLTIVVLGALAAFLAIVAFGFIGFFQIFEAEYDSFGSLFSYIVIAFIISIFLELFARALFNVMSLYISSKVKTFVVRLILDAGCTWFVLFLVDEWMTSVQIPALTELALALLLFLIEYLFDGNGKEKTE